MNSRRPSLHIVCGLVCGLLIASAVFVGACKQGGAGKRYKLAFVTNNSSVNDSFTVTTYSARNGGNAPASG